MILAPKKSPQELWNMNYTDFNNWRDENDYPRIIEYLKKKLPEFIDWMADQKVSDELLIKYTPSFFIKEESFIYLYKVLNNDDTENDIISVNKYSLNETIFDKN